MCLIAGINNLWTAYVEDNILGPVLDNLDGFKGKGGPLSTNFKYLNLISVVDWFWCSSAHAHADTTIVMPHAVLRAGSVFPVQERVSATLLEIGMGNNPLIRSCKSALLYMMMFFFFPWLGILIFIVCLLQQTILIFCLFHNLLLFYIDMAPRKGKEKKEEQVISLGPQVAEGENVFGVCHIFASFNDTFVHVTDLSGKWVSLLVKR